MPTGYRLLPGGDLSHIAREASEPEKDTLAEFAWIADELGGANLTRGIIEDADANDIIRLELARKAAAAGAGVLRFGR